MPGLDNGDAGKVIDQLSQLKDAVTSPIGSQIVSQIGNQVVNQVSRDFANRFDWAKKPEQEWSIWGNQPQNRAPASPEGRSFSQFPKSGLETPGLPKLDLVTQPAPPTIMLRPEQVVGTGRADELTKQAVYQSIEQASKQGNRSVAAGQFMQAINTANATHDPTLQAISKVEFGLANLNWGFSEEGFKWILEAGSNNPSIYDSRSNQSFLQRLARAGMPRSAVDLLMNNGSQDPTWYVKDTTATKKLDAAMTGTAYVPSLMRVDGGQQVAQVSDPLAPPPRKQEVVNPNLPPALQPGDWMLDQIKQVMQSAGQEGNRQNAFGLYKQATDMADRTGDKQLQAAVRVQTGTALISWGNTESGFKWLLDAGSINPALYDNAVNQDFQQQLRRSGVTEPALDMLLKNGQRDANWYLRTTDVAKSLASAMQAGNNPVAKPGDGQYIQVPSAFPPQNNPAPFTPPAPGQEQPPEHKKPNPFGG